MAFQRAPLTDPAAGGSNLHEYAREGSRSPLPATDESSTASPVPSGVSDKSYSNDQESFTLKSQSLRQRTAQACDKCRERKTKCSGHRPVCTRCTNRGLLCEYSIRESRARSMMRLRTVPSPSPFQVNYRYSGGRPTPAYHSRTGISQTSAYDRSPSAYEMLTLDPPTVPPISSYVPSASSSTGQMSDLEVPYVRHPPHIKKHFGMSRELRGWGAPSLERPLTSMNVANQRIASRSLFTSGARSVPREKNPLYSYEYMGRSSVVNPALHSPMHVTESEQRNVLPETPSTMSQSDITYHQYAMQVPDRFTVQDVILTMLRSEGTLSPSEEGANIPLSLISGSSRRSSGGLPTEHEGYDFTGGIAALDFRVTDTDESAAWNALGVDQPPIQAPSLFAPEYNATIANYNSAYSVFDKSGLLNTLVQSTPGRNSTVSRPADLICPTPSLPIGSGRYGTHGGHGSPQDDFQNSGFYDLFAHDAVPDELHSYSAPPVSDSGIRFEGHKFLK